MNEKEITRLDNMLKIEHELNKKGYELVCGVDEAGRARLVAADGPRRSNIGIRAGSEVKFAAAVGCVRVVAVLVAQAGGERRARIVVAVVDEYVRRLLLHGVDPAQQPLLIRVAAHAGQDGDLGVHGDLVAEDLHTLGAVVQLAAERADCLIAHEQHRALRPPEVILQMVADAAGVAHAARGEDDLRRLVGVERHGVFLRDGGVQVVKIQRVDAAADERAGLVVEKARVRLQKDARGLVGERAVHIHGEVRVAVHHAGVLDLANEIQQLLRAADGERRDDDVAALAERFVDDLGKLVGIAPDLGVVAVAVGRLHHDVVGLFEKLRVADDGLVDVADIAGEDDRLVHAVFFQLKRDGRGTEQMARVGEHRAHTLAEVDLFFILAGRHVLENIQRVLLGVERIDMLAARALALAVFVLSVALLNVSGVEQHDLHQICCQACRQDAAVEAVFHQQRDTARVVDVRVGDEQNIDIAGSESEITVVELVAALL